eukprot:Lankesteria_metandrocarpae@DN9856_c0_g1_i1.p1
MCLMKAEWRDDLRPFLDMPWKERSKNRIEAASVTQQSEGGDGGGDGRCDNNYSFKTDRLRQIRNTLARRFMSTDNKNKNNNDIRHYYDKNSAAQYPDDYLTKLLTDNTAATGGHTYGQSATGGHTH